MKFSMTSLRSGIIELVYFAYHEAMSCMFPVFIFTVLALSQYVTIPGLYRYDVILLACLLMQVVMYRTGLESKDELKVIFLFHLIGLALELFKVRMGSWAYPEEAWTKFGGVPLYSGFMYASVASFMCQSWRRLHIRLVRYPHFALVVPLGAAIYLNFFLHHFWVDIRWYLVVLIFVVFLPTMVEFKPQEKVRRISLVLSFFLIGFFVWIAENIATFFGAWQYPNQQQAWNMVHLSKLTSWFLLVIVSFIIVSQLKHVKEALPKGKGSSQTLEQ